MATAPSYTSAPLIGAVAISTANTNKDGTTGTYGTLVPTTTNPTRIERLRVVAIVTTTAGMIRVFASDGTTTWMLREIAVTAVTPSASVAGYAAEIQLTDIILPVGWSLIVSTHNAESFNVFAFGGEIG